MNKNIEAYGHWGDMGTFLELQRKGVDFLLKYYNEDDDGRFYRKTKQSNWKYPRLCHDTVLWKLYRRMQSACGCNYMSYNVEYLDEKNYAVIVRTKIASNMAKFLIEQEGFELV